MKIHTHIHTYKASNVNTRWRSRATQKPNLIPARRLTRLDVKNDITIKTQLVSMTEHDEGKFIS